MSKSERGTREGSLPEEVMRILRATGGSMSSGEIFKQSSLADSSTAVAQVLYYLRHAGRVVRMDAPPGEGRGSPRYVYALPAAAMPAETRSGPMENLRCGIARAEIEAKEAPVTHSIAATPAAAKTDTSARHRGRRSPDVWVAGGGGGAGKENLRRAGIATVDEPAAGNGRKNVVEPVPSVAAAPAVRVKRLREAPPKFRCALRSDGTLRLENLSCGADEVEIDSGETQQLLHYLDRIASPADDDGGVRFFDRVEPGAAS